MFLKIERGRFAGRAHRHKTVDPALELKLNVLAQPSLVQLPFTERRHHRRHRALKHGLSFVLRQLSVISCGWRVVGCGWSDVVFCLFAGRSVACQVPAWSAIAT